MNGWIEGSAKFAVIVSMPLLTVHGLTDAVFGSLALMYHSSSPLLVKVETSPPPKLYCVYHVPVVPFDRFKVLNSSSNVIFAVAARLFGSIATSLTLLAPCKRPQFDGRRARHAPASADE